MRLQATLQVHLPAEAIPREPSLWDRLRRAFGGKVDLESEHARVLLEAAAVVEQARACLKRLGITNAVSLVIDGAVVYSDPHRKPDDLGDLMLAMAEHAPVYGAGFESIRLAAEHEEAGLHLVLELHVLARHRKDEPAARLYIGGRVSELEARPGEAPDDYRTRVAPLITSPALLDSHRRQFEAFAAKVADAMRAAFPEGRVVEETPEAKVVRPTTRAPVREPEPGHPAYDPYARYYPSPFEPMLSGLMIGMFLSSAFHPPFIHVVHPSGAPIGNADELSNHGDELDADAADPGEGGVDEASGYDEAGTFEDGGFDDGGDFGGGDFDGDI